MTYDENKLIAALDIGSEKIVCAVSSMDAYGKLNVLGIGKAPSEGVDKGRIINIDKTVKGIQKAVMDAGEAANVNIGEVNVAVSGHQIFCTQQTATHIRKEQKGEIGVNHIRQLKNDLFKSVTTDGQRIIHVLPQYYRIDNETTINDPVGMAGVRIEGHYNIITANERVLEALSRSLDRVGIDMQYIIAAPIASASPVVTDYEKKMGVAVIDMGAETTTITVFHEGMIAYLSVFPFGGAIITNDIRKGCSVMDFQAELLKTRFGNALSDEAANNEIVSIPSLNGRPAKEISVKNLAYIIESRLQEMFEIVHSRLIEIGFEQKVRQGAGIVLTGGAAKLKNINSLAEYVTGIDVRTGYPNEPLGRIKDEEIKQPEYASLVGLLQAGFYSWDERENRYESEEAGGENMIILRSEKGGKGIKRSLDFISRFLRDEVNQPNQKNY